jgi:hypothetical protein
VNLPFCEASTSLSKKQGKSKCNWIGRLLEGGTRVRMEQSGFGPQDDNNYKGAAYGWQRNIGALEKVVAGLG